MRRKLYSSKRVKKTALVYTRETEREIMAEKCNAAINQKRSAALVRVLGLIDTHRMIQQIENLVVS